MARSFSSAAASSIPSPNQDSNPYFIQRKALVDYILAHREGDKRPYLQVTVLGYPFLGLLDSGSSVTLVGRSGLDILLVLDLN